MICGESYIIYIWIRNQMLEESFSYLNKVYYEKKINDLFTSPHADWL